MNATRTIRQRRDRPDRRGAVSSPMEEILILTFILPASWFFYRFVVWWSKAMFNVISPLVDWAYL